MALFNYYTDMAQPKPEPNKYDDMKKIVEDTTKGVLTKFKEEIKNYDPTQCSEKTHTISEAIVT